MAAKNNGGFSENPPHFSRHIFITYGIHYQSQSERTKVTMRILKIQKDKSEALLFRMLPYSVVKELRKCWENNSLYVHGCRLLFRLPPIGTLGVGESGRGGFP